jgi:hypothetical protein
MENLIPEYSEISVLLEQVGELRGQINTQINKNTNSGKKLNLDGINTIAIVNSSIPQIDFEELRNILSTFVKNSRLLTQTIAVNISQNRTIINVDMPSNPGVDVIESIYFDTENDSPELKITRGTVMLSDDVVNFISNVSRAYKDPQSGRNKLIEISRNDNV